MLIWSFTHSHVISNLYEFVSWKNFFNLQSMETGDIKLKKTQKQHNSIIKNNSCTFQVLNSFDSFVWQLVLTDWKW